MDSDRMFKTQRTAKPTKKLKYQRALSKFRFLAQRAQEGNTRLLQKKINLPYK